MEVPKTKLPERGFRSYNLAVCCEGNPRLNGQNSITGSVRICHGFALCTPTAPSFAVTSVQLSIGHFHDHSPYLGMPVLLLG